MKPRNKEQKTIAELSSSLSAITEKQKNWAFEHCFEAIGYFSNQTIWCNKCGHSWKTEESELASQICGTKCPHCGNTLNIHSSRRIKEDIKEYYSVFTTCHGYQVIRHYIVHKQTRKSMEPMYDIHEVVQQWINQQGKETVMARPTKMSYYYYDLWNYYEPLSIKSNLNEYKYNIYAKFIYPAKRILPILKRNGFNGFFHGLCPSSLFRLILRSNQAETLLKAKQYSLLCHMNKIGFYLPYWDSIKICIRNKYIVKDASLWCDYIKCLSNLNMDIHNAKYVCPKDLKSSHDLYMKRLVRIQEKEKYEKERDEALKEDAEYKKMKSAYFGICFGDDKIKISVLKSVIDFLDEGKAMHHCVYGNKYYLRDDSLILTARNNISGERLETVEVSLKTLNVVQSRGICNSSTEFHDRIISLVKGNMNMIRQKIIS